MRHALPGTSRVVGIGLAALMALAGSLSAQNQSRASDDSAFVSASRRIWQEAASGPVTSPITGARISSAAVHTVLAMMSDPPIEVRQHIRMELARSGAADAVVDRLVAELPGLFSHLSSGQLQIVLGDFNALVNGATPGFLVRPPDEFLALHSILLQISTALNEAHG